MAFDSNLDTGLVERASEAVEQLFPSTLGLLGALVKIPGIAWDSYDAEELTRSAERVRQELVALRIFDWVEVRSSTRPDGKPGAPAVLARRAGEPAAPHVLLYSHHDVQPPGNENDWLSPPFEVTLRGERLFGRGVADDKAGIVTHIASLSVLRDLASSQRLGITVFVEGEEEAGSPTFRRFLEENQADLKADLIVVADSGNLSTETPSLTASLRGLVSQVIEVKTLDHAVHSGVFGGVAPDAFLALTKLIATLHDANGAAAISGLTTDKVPQIEYSEAQFRAESGLLPATELITRDLCSGLWGAPAVSVIGIDYPSVANSSNTLHPAVKAKISVRISPSQDPEEALDALRRHLLRNVPFGAQLEFGEVEKGRGYFARSGWAADTARKALSLAWGRDEQSIGLGGTIPFIADLQQLFPDAEVIVTGIEDPDSRAHSPNESQHIPTLRRAILAQSLLLLHGNSLSRD